MPPCAMDLNTNLQKFKNSFDSSKDRLDTKILIQDKKKPFLSPKNFNWTSLKLALNCTCKGCWSVLSLYVWLVIIMFLEKKIVSLNSFEWFEYKKNAGFLKLKLGFCVLKLELFVSWVLFEFCLLTQRSLALCGRSKGRLF